MVQGRGSVRRRACARLVCVVITTVLLASCGEPQGSGKVTVIGTDASWKAVAPTGMKPRFVHATVWTWGGNDIRQEAALFADLCRPACQAGTKRSESGS